jgi:hypothetical protein
VAPSEFASPPYSAVITWDPIVKDEVESVATPEPLRGADPNATPPSLNIIVPVGSPAVDMTVAVKVTD